MTNYQDRVIYFLVLATLSCWLGFALRKKILEISDSATGFLGQPGKLIKQISVPISALLNRVLIPAHFVLLGIALDKTGEAEKGFKGMLLLGAGFAIAVFVAVFLLKRLVRPLAEKAGIAEVYPAAYVAVASFGGGNRGFVMLYLLSISPLFAHLIGSDSVTLINRYIAFDAGYYLFFLVFFLVWIRPKMFDIKGEQESFSKTGILDFFPPSLILVSIFLGPIVKAAGFNPAIPDSIIRTLQTSVGNVMFFLATVYMILSLPRKIANELGAFARIGGVLAVLLPRAAAVAVVVGVINLLHRAHSLPPLFLQHGLIIVCIFCLLPASSVIFSLLDSKSESNIRDQSVSAWIVNTNLYFLIYLLVIALFVGVELLF